MTERTAALSRSINPFHPIGAHQQQTNLATAFTVDKAILADDALEDEVNCVLIFARSVPIRYTLDGTNPTASLGFYKPTTVNEPILIYLSSDTVLKVIEAAAGSILEYQFGKLV